MTFQSEQDNIISSPDRQALPDTTFRALADALPDALLCSDESGKIIYANEAAVVAFAGNQSALAGRPLSDFLPDLEQAVLTPPPRSRCLPVSALTGSGERLSAEVTSICSRRGGALFDAWLVQYRGSRTPAHRFSEVLATVGEKLSAASTPREVATMVLDSADHLFGWDCAFIDLISDEDNELHAVLSIDLIDGNREEVPPRYTGVPTGSNTRKTLDFGAHMILRDEAPSTQLQSAVPFGNTSLPSASLMFAPIRKENKNIGVLSIQSYRPHAYTGEDLALLQTLADYSSGAFRRTAAEERAARAEQAVREERERFQLIARATNDVVYDWDIATGSIWWNECMETLFGHPPGSIPRDLNWWTERIHPDDREPAFRGLQDLIEAGGNFWSTEYRFRRNDGSYAHVFDRGFIVHRDGKALRMIGSMMDITARKRAEAELRHGAYHDLLTGLPNRAAFMEELQRTVAHAGRRTGYKFALLFLDLDRFKNVNDSLGHAAGDQLLITIARRLEECIRPGDLVARLGGDEFIILLDDIKDERDATTVAERILSCLSKPVNISGREAYTSACVGIALGSNGLKPPEELLRDADTAMYRAKASGRNRYHIFDVELHSRVVSVLQIETDLRRALERDQFVLHYQPVIELETGSVTGFEALVRWQHPERGLIPPAEFIPIAEDTGLISPLGWWVLREATSTLARWQQSDSSLSHLTMSVNISAHQLAEPRLVDQVAHALRETGIAPDCLKLEITETAIMDNAEAAVTILARLRDMGVELHVDDFGTGHSSLGYLHRLPIHALKIDRTFVRDLATNQESHAICSTIIALAKNIGIGVIAEGLETPEQVEHLLQLGCLLGQGFYFSKPVNAKAARLYISALEA